MAYVITEKAATALTRLLRGDKSTGNTGARGAPATISPDAFPAPFTVRWSASEDSGNGAWVIWLPNKARLCYYRSQWRDIGNVSAAQTLPSGWYTMTMVRPQDRAVYLSVRDYGSGSGRVVSANIVRTDTQGATDYPFCALVATMEVDSTTGARRVRQCLESTAEIPAAAESADPDGISIDYNNDGDLQIYQFDDGLPAAATTIAGDLVNAPSTPDTLVVRTANGGLAYKSVGDLGLNAGGYTLAQSAKVITGVSWDATNHTIVISSAQVSITKGLITAWAPNADEVIPTTPISSIIGS